MVPSSDLNSGGRHDWWYPHHFRSCTGLCLWYQLLPSLWAWLGRRVWPLCNLFNLMSTSLEKCVLMGLVDTVGYRLWVKRPSFWESHPLCQSAMTHFLIWSFTFWSVLIDWSSSCLQHAASNAACLAVLSASSFDRMSTWPATHRSSTSTLSCFRWLGTYCRTPKCRCLMWHLFQNNA